MPKAYFISDLHLGARYIPDTHEAERRVVRFLESIRHDATDLYLLGDILDFWFEYRTVVPRGYVRFLGALASLADAGVKIHWYIGNHDIWLFDYLRSEIGMEIIDGYRVEEIYGKRFFLNHGDGVGHLPRTFRFLRAFFRNRTCQRLFAAIHPRWTLPFALGWSKSNRQAEGQLALPFQGPEKEPLAIFAAEYLRDVDPSINYFVFGHRHTEVDIPLSPTCRLIILGDWISQFTYAAFDGTNLTLANFH